MVCCVPPPPLPRNHLAQEPPPGSAVEFLHHSFLPQYWVFHGSGGCRTAIQVCRTTFHVCCYGSPHQGGTLSVSHRRVLCCVFVTEGHLNVIFVPPSLLLYHLFHSLLCIIGGALSAVRVQCNYLGVWPY